MKLSLASLLCVTAVAGSFESSALADPEVRDHRSPVAQPSGPSIESRPRYRRRPGPRFMMPLKVDIGAAFADTTRGGAQGIAGAVGIHWASLSPRPTNTDIGIGVFGALLVAPEDTTVMDDVNGIAYGGAYLELGHTLSQGSFWRTWASGRGEYLASSAFGDDHTGVGAAGRLSAELFVSGAGVETRGVFLGTYAIGAYAEVGARDVVEGLGSLHASVGLTFRTPLVFAP